MTKALYISLAALVFVAFLDIISFHLGNPELAKKSLLEFSEEKFAELRNELLSDEFISILEKDSISNADLNRLKKRADNLKKEHIAIALKKSDTLVFWTSIEHSRSYCRTYRKKDKSVKICLDYFSQDSLLKPEINVLAGISHILKLESQVNESQKSWNGHSLKSLKRHRSYRLNNLFILAFLLTAIALIYQCFMASTIWPVLLLMAARITQLLFGNWNKRFVNSSLELQLFDWHSYSNIDLFIDCFILFSFLSMLARGLSCIDKKNHSIKLFTHALVLILSILTQLRIIQLVALCDSFNVAINDISTISIAEVVIFLAIILFQAGIFILTTSLFQNLKKNYSGMYYYASLSIIVFVSSVLSALFMLELSMLYLTLFLICFFLLIDLFLDIQQKSITWVIWWAIFFGISLSALFFNYDIKKQIDARQEFLESLFTDLEEETVQDAVESALLDGILNEFKSLIVLPDEASYNKADLENYFNTKYPGKDVYLDIVRGTTKLFNRWPGKTFLVELGNSYYFDHIDNRLWKEAFSDSTRYFTGINLLHADNARFEYTLINERAMLNRGIEADKLELMTAYDYSQDSNNAQYIDKSVILSYNDESGIQAINIKEFESIVKPIALFSFLFTLIILAFSIIGISHTYFQILPENWPLKISQFESLNARVQVALILVILLSFILISLVTSSFLESFIEQKNNQFLSEKIESVSRDLAFRLDIATNADEAQTIAGNFIEELEKVHGVELRIQSLREEKPLFNFFPYLYFSRQSQANAYSVVEKNGSYLSFIPFSFNNQIAGFVSMKEPSDSVSGFKLFDFLGSIFNVYVFLFLIASVLAIVIAKSITRPLSLLNQKLVALRLGKRNELINWDREDEMGSLINNYNKMVKQLENSVELLAKTERDNAWREMAKQVAHEIKNPLTPMRMYIQHLEKAVKQQPERAVEISKKISSTLLEQVENLTQIADSFSNFAELPQSSNEKIELNKVVELVHNLFRKRDDMEVLMTEPIDPVIVYADKNQVIRILNNLVKNAIESIPADRKGRIDIDLYIKEEKAIVRVSDNGIGIDEEMKDKIFQPKFTTKDSGSGLGLAIALNMIESMNGRLYFKSKNNEGTSFYIELDIIRQNYDVDSKRITLD